MWLGLWAHRSSTRRGGSTSADKASPERTLSDPSTGPLQSAGDSSRIHRRTGRTGQCRLIMQELRTGVRTIRRGDHCHPPRVDSLE